MATNAAHVHPGPGTPGLPITSLETPPGAEARRPVKTRTCKSGARARSPLRSAEGTDFWPGEWEHPPASFFPSAHESCGAGGSGRRRIQRGELRPRRCTTPHPPPRSRNKTCDGRASTQLCARGSRIHRPPSLARRPHLRNAGWTSRNFPFTGQPAATPPRLGPAPGAADRPSRVPKSTALAQKLRSSLATLTYASQYRRCLNRHPAPRLRLRLRLRPTGSSGSRWACQDNPRRRRGGALKGPGGLFCTTGSSSLPEHNLFAERPHLTME
ncbi:uncharacterized protein LOC129138147 [Pan troglodytes]|uniref:uncharacterized protein LOC129138147 n=1 Tax=Pan troglodytes TaxID=9598 RepID=UPI0023F12FC4|nr:uncharacterized protein LOC129138147 [Pan troglodytes]